MPAMSLIMGVTNLAMPSTSSVSVTSSMSMPASASLRRSSTGSVSAVAPRISPWSPTASIVSTGMVLTVSGATSSSTYIVSG